MTTSNFARKKDRSMHWQPLILFWALVAALSVLSFMITAAYGQTYEEQSHILILHSYHKGLTWTDNVTQGIEEELAKSHIPVKISIEYMDTKRIASAAYFEQLAELYQLKYAHRKINVILCSDDNAFNFVRHYHESIFNNIPVVFCGVNYFEDDMLAGLPQATGVLESFDISATLRAALDLHPKANKLVVINDRTVTGKANKKQMDKAVAALPRLVQMTYLNSYTMAEIQDSVSTLNENHIVLWLHFAADPTGRYYTFHQSAEMISAASKAPLYSFWDFHLGHGIVGGMLTSGRLHGQKAAQLALRIINGESAASIPVVRKSPNQYMFDYKQLIRFGIALDRLPPSSIIINRPTGFYKRYKRMLWTAIVGFTSLSAVILFLLANTIRRRKAEQALTEAKNRYQTIFNHAASGMAIVDQQGIYQQVNTALCLMLGYSKEKLIQKNWRDVTHSDDIDLTLATIKKLLKGETAPAVEKRYINKQNKIVWALFNAALIFDKKGMPLYYIAQMQDITPIKEAQAKLREREERYLQIFEADLSGVYVVSPEGKIVMCNQVFAEMFGYEKPEQVLQINIIEFYKNPENRKKLLDNLIRQKKVEHFEVELKRQDGTPIHCLINATGRFDSQGQLMETQGYIMDITHQKQLEKQLLHAQKMESIGTMAGGLAHDFNNLLMGIMGNATLLLMDKDEVNLDYGPLKSIEQYVRSGSDLTRQLLGFAKGGKYEVQTTNLNHLIQRSVKMFARTHKAISVFTLLDEDLWVVEVDRSQIDQVLYNMYVNAWQAMNDCGDLHIRTQNKYLEDHDLLGQGLKPGKYVEITIADNGVGMDDETRQRIFDPFFTTKERGRGTGLGLASAYGIVQNHAGFINVVSRKREGTTFHIYLPASDKQLEIIEEKPSSPTQFTSGNENILLIDDENMVIRAVSAMLNHLGYNVFTAQSGKEAIALLKKKKDKIDLVILDMIMPGMGGGDTFEQIKSIHPDIKVILSSGYSAKGQAADILKRGCQGFIQKPFTLNALSQKINEVFRQEYKPPP